MSGAANCPETPRQKMIGMMYLFLTAMLALNISKDILNAFVVVNEGLEATNGNFEAKNGQTMNAIDFAYQNDKIKVKAALDAATQTQKVSSELVAYIDTLKKQVINLTDLSSDEINSVYGDTIPLIHVKGKDNSGPSTRFFMGGSTTTGEASIDGIAGKAPELKVELDDYVKTLKNLLKGLNVKGVDKLGDLGVNTKNPEEQSMENPEENYWASSNFYHLPLAATVAILSQMENQVRNAEATVLNKINSSIGATDMKFDGLEARVVPKSTYVIQGGDYEADLFVAAWSTTSKPKVIVGPASKLDTVKWEFKPGTDTTQVNVVDGVGKYKVKAGALGEQKYASIIEVKNTSTGDVQTYPLAVEGNYYAKYMVAKPSAVISPTKMNVFYMGVENPVSISVPGFAAENVSATITGGTIRAANKGKGEYIVKVSKRGKSYITVNAVDENGNKTSFPKQEFRVKKVPDPIAKVAGKSSGTIAKTKLSMAGNILAEMDNFDFQMKAIVTGFVVSGTVGGYTKEAKSADYKLTAKQKDIIKKSKRGSRVTFEQIKCKVAGSTRQLRDISLKLK